MPPCELKYLYFELQLSPGVHELVDIIRTIKQILSETDSELSIQPDTKVIKSGSATPNSITLCSELSKVLVFTETYYPEGLKTSQKNPKTSNGYLYGQIHLKCD